MPSVSTARSAAEAPTAIGIAVRSAEEPTTAAPPSRTLSARQRLTERTLASFVSMEVIAKFDCRCIGLRASL